MIALTPEERETIITCWADVDRRGEIDAIQHAHGFTRRQIQNQAYYIRKCLYNEGDARSEDMLSRANNDMSYDENEVIKDYGVVSPPDIYADKDPRPEWLVITSHRFPKDWEFLCD